MVEDLSEGGVMMKFTFTMVTDGRVEVSVSTLLVDGVKIDDGLEVKRITDVLKTGEGCFEIGNLYGETILIPARSVSFVKISR
jgi:hypothetical protein